MPKTGKSKKWQQETYALCNREKLSGTVVIKGKWYMVYDIKQKKC